MKREDLIKKWLDNELNIQELEEFKALEDYEALVKLSNSTKLFKAPEFNTSEELNTVLDTINTAKQYTRNKGFNQLREYCLAVLIVSNTR